MVDEGEGAVVVSRYGRLWEQLRAVRVKMCALVPGVSETATLEEAQIAAEAHMKSFCRQINVLSAEWEQLEAEMAKEAE